MRMPWLLGIFAAVLGLAFGSEKKAHARSSAGRHAPMSGPDPTYTMDYWRPLLAQRLAQFHPDLAERPGALAFIMAWMLYETGGNPCGYGDPPPTGTAPDGQPREIGLGQLYNPDDFNRLAPALKAKLGVTLSSKTMRAYCQPGTQHRTRELTPDEMIEQIEGLLGLVDLGVSAADQALARNELSWNELDTWKLSKAEHALPSIVKGIDALGHMGKHPSGWDEYRVMLNGAGGAWAPDARDASKVSDRNPSGYVNFAMHRGFEMCDKCGRATLGQGVA
jgi:hypothetical protein